MNLPKYVGFRPSKEDMKILRHALKMLYDKEVGGKNKEG